MSGLKRPIDRMRLLCCAVFPPPPMARLQPMPASHELLAPFDVAIRALRPNWAKPDPEMRKEVLRLGWKVLEETGRYCFNAKHDNQAA